MQQGDRPYRIGISGSYGGMNLGDEAILASIVSQLRASLPVEITIFSRNPEDTLGRHDVERAIPVRELNQKEIGPEIERLDLFVLGGGGILFDGDVHNYLREVFLAHERNVPVMVYAISAGPLTDSRARRAVRDALNSAAIVTVRDRQGLRLLEDVGVSREIHLTGDPVAAHMRKPGRAEILRRRYSPQQILDVLGHFEFAIGMRLHFLIFAALQGTPFVALPYASKITGFIQDFGVETPPLGDFSVGQLIARIDRSWDSRAETRAKVRQMLPVLQDRARETNRLLVEFLTARHSDRALAVT